MFDVLLRWGSILHACSVRSPSPSATSRCNYIQTGFLHGSIVSAARLPTACACMRPSVEFSPGGCALRAVMVALYLQPQGFEFVPPTAAACLQPRLVLEVICSMQVRGDSQVKHRCHLLRLGHPGHFDVDSQANHRYTTCCVLCTHLAAM